MTIAELQKCGFRVPEDISVVGFDGETRPGIDDGLTTVKLPFYTIGCRAVELLAEYYEKGIHDGNRQFKLPTSLILKRSLGMAPADARVKLPKSRQMDFDVAFGLQTQGVNK